MSDSLLASLLVKLGVSVRETLRQQRLALTDAARVVAVSSHDTVFALDRHVEDLLIETIKLWPADVLPVAVFAEGFAQAPVYVGGTHVATPRYWLMLDPIDGTRGLMFDKRSAYFLAAAAPGSCVVPTLSQCVVSVGVELPTSKAGWADTFTWIKGKEVDIRRDNLLDGSSEHLSGLRPSQARDLSNAFGSVVAFFPTGKRIAAVLAEEIASCDPRFDRPQMIFDDQYISTGGQLIELLTGRDRFVVDIRPLLERGKRAQCCHPYDLALAPLAAAAGVVLCAPNGGVFDAPFGLDTDVSWCGYANTSIRDVIQPVVSRFIEPSLTARHLV